MEGSLRGSSEVVAREIRDEIQSRVNCAGLEIIEARITYLAYAPEIAAGNASAPAGICYHRCPQDDRRRSRRMVEMALERLSETIPLGEPDVRSARQLWFLICWLFCAAIKIPSR